MAKHWWNAFDGHAEDDELERRRETRSGQVNAPGLFDLPGARGRRAAKLDAQAAREEETEKRAAEERRALEDAQDVLEKVRKGKKVSASAELEARRTVERLTGRKTRTKARSAVPPVIQFFASVAVIGLVVLVYVRANRSGGNPPHDEQAASPEPGREALPSVPPPSPRVADNEPRAVPPPEVPRAAPQPPVTASAPLPAPVVAEGPKRAPVRQQEPPAPEVLRDAPVPVDPVPGNPAPAEPLPAPSVPAGLLALRQRARTSQGLVLIDDSAKPAFIRDLSRCFALKDSDALWADRETVRYCFSVCLAPALFNAARALGDCSAAFGAAAQLRH